MDLIYMNQDRVELGILQHYILDLDLAKDKDFELKTLDDEVILEAGYWWYIADTEYGGRIDKVSHDTNAKAVTYYGRNWRGLLNSKIIEPLDDTSSVIADGSVAESFQSLIARSGYDDLFTVNTTTEAGEVELTTPIFSYPRWCTLYEGMMSLLTSLNAKLDIHYDGITSRVVIKPKLITDHSDYLTYISENSLNFVVSQRKGGINHLVCLGQSDEEHRAVIHLFLDESGALQPYRKTETPVRNSDYILTKDNQQIFGLDERATVYDYPNAGITYNYVMLPTQPRDWAEYYYNYYNIVEQEEEDDLSTLKYKAVEPVVVENYTELESKPADWENGQGKYYTFDGSSYHPVGLIESEPTWTTLDNVPDDWSSNYGEYYIESWDGVQTQHTAVSSATKEDPRLQTKEPDDWATNYTKYYMLRSVAEQEYGEKVYKRAQGVAPAWKTGTYFKRSGDKYSPVNDKPDKWTTYYSDYYTRKKNSKGDWVYSRAQAVAPTWKSSTYYKRDGDKYKLVNSKPDKWSEYYKDYYTMSWKLPSAVENSTSKYVKVRATASNKAPKWVKNKYYTLYTYSVAPKFKKSTVGNQKVVVKTTTEVMPEFESGTYYSYIKMEVAPQFVVGLYYEKTEDWYKILVEGGIERLADLNKSESQTVTLADMPAEIGDVVSGYDLITGIEVYERVTNIIVKIKNNVISIDYEVGGKN